MGRRDTTNRRTCLRRVGSALAATGAIGIAGCTGDGSGDGGGNGGDGNGEGGDGNGGATTTVAGAGEYENDERGSVAENTVDELAIVGHTAEVREPMTSSDPRFVVTIAVKNLGDQETELFDYNYVLRLFDDEGTKLGDARAVQFNVGGGTTVAPGKTTEIGLHLQQTEDPGAVARYEIVLNCGFEDGVYCENS